MCIICNCPDDGDRFLTSFEASRHAMKKAGEAMLTCSKSSISTTAGKNYDSTYKKMVRLIHEWNRLEEFRETGHK